MRKKIALVDPASYVLPYDYYYISQIAKHYDVDFYCSVSPYNWTYAEKLQQLPGVTVFPFAISSVSRFRGVINYFRLLWKLFLQRSGYQAIHFQFQILKGISAILELSFLVLIRRKLMFTLHSPVPHGYIRSKTYWVYRWLARLSRQLIFVSKHSRNSFIQDYDYSGDVHVMNLGLMPLEPGERLAAVNADIEMQPVVVFWGNVKSYKGVDLLVDMAECGLFDDVRFEVHGKWDGELADLKTRLTEMGVKVTDRFLDMDEVRALLNRPVIFIFPYRRASQSGVLYTLLHYGCTFITSDTGDNADFARRHQMSDLIFDREDLQTIRNAFDYAMDNSARIKRKMASIRTEYDWNSLVQGIEEIYERM